MHLNVGLVVMSSSFIATNQNTDVSLVHIIKIISGISVTGLQCSVVAETLTLMYSSFDQLKSWYEETINVKISGESMKIQL